MINACKCLKQEVAIPTAASPPVLVTQRFYFEMQAGFQAQCWPTMKTLSLYGLSVLYDGLKGFPVTNCLLFNDNYFLSPKAPRFPFLFLFDSDSYPVSKMQ